MRGRPLAAGSRLPDVAAGARLPDVAAGAGVTDGGRPVTDDGDGGTVSAALPGAAVTPLLPRQLDNGLPDTPAPLSTSSGGAANDESPVAATRPAVPLLAANETSHCGTPWPDLSITSATPPAAASSCDRNSVVAAPVRPARPVRPILHSKEGWQVQHEGRARKEIRIQSERYMRPER